MDGRVATLDCRVGLGDVRPDSTQRLDAIARTVQDVADLDYATLGGTGTVTGAGTAVDGMGMWILRRLTLDIAHTPRMRAECRARTWVSGIGARWIERRTDIEAGDRAAIAATAIWVHVDPVRRSPAPIPPGFAPVWFPVPDGRRISARLRHPPPPAGAVRHGWPVRATDVDVLGHVNNAAYWAAAEEELARRGSPRVRAAAIEFGGGVEPGEPVEAVYADRDDGFGCWLCVGGEVRASMTVGCGP